MVSTYSPEMSFPLIYRKRRQSKHAKNRTNTRDKQKTAIPRIFIKRAQRFNISEAKATLPGGSGPMRSVQSSTTTLTMLRAMTSTKTGVINTRQGASLTRTRSPATSQLRNWSAGVGEWLDQLPIRVRPQLQRLLFVSRVSIKNPHSQSDTLARSPHWSICCRRRARSPPPGVIHFSCN